eukprot:CAMPEP_0195099488 /NCGR_PEP_ID=MMETSP0448-20130528/58310_1 /TAXON_ID=66468 /ORGANISM="Heterocapsa triquestra, Strain CCMP 448" /LENGTH=30 /DNA_ID= /DNA_START= /DNA_END= /DNA_ORIENTATION=
MAVPQQVAVCLALSAVEGLPKEMWEGTEVG